MTTNKRTRTRSTKRSRDANKKDPLMFLLEQMERREEARGQRSDELMKSFMQMVPAILTLIKGLKWFEPPPLPPDPPRLSALVDRFIASIPQDQLKKLTEMMTPEQLVAASDIFRYIREATSESVSSSTDDPIN